MFLFAGRRKGFHGPLDPFQPDAIEASAGFVLPVVVLWIGTLVAFVLFALFMWHARRRLSRPAVWGRA